MKLSDVSNGPDWIVWGDSDPVFGIVHIFTYGSWKLADRRAIIRHQRREKGNYDGKKLCRVTGGGLAVVTILLVVMELLEINFRQILPGLQPVLFFWMRL